MAKARKIFLLRERRETWRVRFDRKLLGACEQCEMETHWMTCGEAAKAAATTEREMFRMTESGIVHTTESDDGQLFICGRSVEGLNPGSGR